MNRPRALPHLAVVAALITSILPLTALLPSGWFAASSAMVVATVALGYAGRWVRASLAVGLQALAWLVGVWWAYPGGLADLVGLSGWGVPRVVDAAAAQIMTSVAPVDVGAPLRFVLVGAIGLLAILIDATANAWRTPLVAALPLAAVFIAPQIAVPQGDHLLYAVAFAAALLLLIASRGSREPRRRSQLAAVAIVVVAAAGAVLATPAIPFAPTTGVSLYTRPTSVDVSIELGDDLRNRSNVEVMQLRTSLAAAPYLRLATHTRFDDDGWRVDAGASDPLGAGFDAEELPDAIETVERTTWIDQVRLETPYLPLPEGVIDVRGVGGYWQAMASNRTARTSTGTAQGLAYSVRSVEAAPTREQFEALRVADGPGAALEVTPEVANGPIAQAARAATSSARTPYDRALALQSWLRSDEFGYSLDTPVTDGFDGSDAEAVERFLEVREGYCVHFASAFTLMARSVGLPTRIAIGYLPGAATNDRVDGRTVYSVTADRLHAWPEVRFDEIGWISFDPTPAIAQAQNVTAVDAEERPGPAETAAPEREDEAPAPGPTASESTTPTPTASAAAPVAPAEGGTRGGWLAVVGLVAIALAALPWALRRAIRLRRLAAAHRGDAIVAWRELVAMVDDARIPRSLALSERALARCLLAAPDAAPGASAPQIDAEALSAIVDAVEAARYSGSTPRREDLAAPLRALEVGIRPAWWGLMPRSLWRR